MLLRHQIPSYADTLAKRAKEFGLEDPTSKYPLLVQYDWLRPTFHVPVPEEWMSIYVSSVYESSQNEELNRHWAARFESKWFLDQDEISQDEWFVNPLFRKGSTRAEFFENAKPINDPHNWHRKHLADGRVYVAAFDYFFEWQLFRYADVVHYEKMPHPHIWQLGDYQWLKRHANEGVTEADFDRKAALPRWDAWSKPFTWLAYFIEFDRAFREYVFRRDLQPNDHSSDRETRRRKDFDHAKLGAKQLLLWLGVSVAELESSMQSCFLTLAQEWRWRNYDTDKSKRALWRALQLQVDALLRWLWLAGDHEDSYYLQKHSYTFFGQQTWAQLEDVVPYADWKAARSFSKDIGEVSRRYPDTKFPSIGGFSPSAAYLLSLSAKHPAFADYLHAMHRFVEDSTYRNEDDPFRKRNRDSWYRVIAVLSEILFEVIEKQKTDADAIKKSIGGAKKIAPLCVVAERLAAMGTQFNKVKSRGQGVPHEKYLEILADGVRKAHNKETLILYFTLAIHAARNGQAHAYGRDHQFLSADWAAPVFDALVFLCHGQ
jgi:hypothetical protein